jgi:hypothetical protein
MKLFSFALVLSLFSLPVAGKETAFTGSTPADPVIRSFLGIPLSDSIDFIRWDLHLNDQEFRLKVNFGIGKPNTNGFINGGKKLELRGNLKRGNNYYTLQHNNKRLRLVALNENLLHFLATDDRMLVGNGGWSYTLNSMNPVATDNVSVKTASTTLRDSMVFDGRTPCKIPGVVPAGQECYKLKWRVILYADVAKGRPNGFRIFGTQWRTRMNLTGQWQIVNGKNNRTIYRLRANNPDVVLYLLKTDENILVFTDADGKLLVGDEDFSYTLNKVK